MNTGHATWIVLMLPAIFAGGVAAYTGIWLYPVIFAIGYVAAAAYSTRWGPEGWVLVFAGGEPLVLATAAVSPIFTVPVQIAVLWAAMLTGWEGEQSASMARWALLVGGVVAVAGVAGIYSDRVPLLLVGAASIGLAAAAGVWLGELHLKKRVGIQR
jgi:hypothetical protein